MLNQCLLGNLIIGPNAKLKQAFHISRILITIDCLIVATNMIFSSFHVRSMSVGSTEWRLIFLLSGVLEFEKFDTIRTLLSYIFKHSRHRNMIYI